jgi:hypothetical protein
MSNEKRKYMDKVQAKEPRAIVCAESMHIYRDWCRRLDLAPEQVRRGRHPDFIGAFIAPQLDMLRGMQRGLKWIEVGQLDPDLKRYLTLMRMADWQ